MSREYNAGQYQT